MSTTAMWLLLAVVVIVIVFASVLYKRTFTVSVPVALSYSHNPIPAW